MEEMLLKRLTYAKYLYSAAAAGLGSQSPLAAAEALLRVHDSIEIFQLVVLEKLDISRKPGSGFMEFWESVRSRVGREPPYKDRLRQLNEMRVAFKHHAILPNLNELRELSTTVRLFLLEVSRDFLVLDFSAISVAGLVDDPDVREHIMAAENLITSQDYKAAVAELAIAFDFTVHQKYSEVPDYLSDIFGPTRFSQPQELNRNNLPYELLGLAWEIEKALERLDLQLHQQGEMLEMIAWKIDWQRYSKFKYLAPQVLQTLDGKFHFAWTTSLGRPLIQNDSEFCIQFVLDTALVIQAQKFRVPDQFAVHQIRTIADPTTLYSVDGDGATTCVAMIPKGVQLLGTFCFPPKFGEAWHVSYGDIKGVIKLCEVVLVNDE